MMKPENVIDESIKNLVDFTNILRNKIIISNRLVMIIVQLESY